MPPKKLVSNEGHLLRMRIRNSQDVLAQKLAKSDAYASRLDVMLHNPTERHVLSTEDATRISKKITSITAKLEQASQMYRCWDAVEDGEQRKIVWKTGQEGLRKIDDEIVTVDLEMLRRYNPVP